MAWRRSWRRLRFSTYTWSTITWPADRAHEGGARWCSSAGEDPGARGDGAGVARRTAAAHGRGTCSPSLVHSAAWLSRPTTEGAQPKAPSRRGAPNTPSTSSGLRSVPCERCERGGRRSESGAVKGAVRTRVRRPRTSSFGTSATGGLWSPSQCPVFPCAAARSVSAASTQSATIPRGSHGIMAMAKACSRPGASSSS